MTETLVLIGTAKGLFSLRSTDGRRHFELDGPELAGEEVYATCIDARGLSPRLLAGSVSMHWGPVIRRSDNLGESWTEQDETALAFPADTAAALARIWQLTPGPVDQPDVVYAGVEPAALFRSDDGGRSFGLVRALWDHPHRSEWPPGGGGLCMHTVLVHPTDPARLLVAVSAGGVYRSDDGGDTWRASNAGIVAGFLPGAPTPEFGQCVHKVARDVATPSASTSSITTASTAATTAGPTGCRCVPSPAPTSVFRSSRTPLSRIPPTSCRWRVRNIGAPRRGGARSGARATPVPRGRR